MMNMAAGFLQPTQGRVTLDGKAIATPGPDRGVMFQDYGVFPWLIGRGQRRFRAETRSQSQVAQQSARRSSSATFG